MGVKETINGSETIDTNITGIESLVLVVTNKHAFLNKGN